ncbi:hypothetical protein, partial [Bradyrhizobium sp.]|uniref:hypothetical protein n=1 Tax=Bradyrhizobium sp. TaxID=376 RepID=UPI003C6F0A51
CGGKTWNGPDKPGHDCSRISEVPIIWKLALLRPLSRTSRRRVGVGEAPGENPSIAYRGYM